MASSSYPQSWTLTRIAKDLERTGHTVFYRGDGAHHDPIYCGACRRGAPGEAVKEQK